MRGACNFLLSLLSLHAALALVAAGANGDTTRRELLGLLGSGSLSATQLVSGDRAPGPPADVLRLWRLGGPAAAAQAAGRSSWRLPVPSTRPSRNR